MHSIHKLRIVLILVMILISLFVSYAFIHIKRERMSYNSISQICNSPFLYSCNELYQIYPFCPDRIERFNLMNCSLPNKTEVFN